MNTIKKKISDGRKDKAILELLELYPNNKDIILISSRCKNNENEFNMGIKTLEDFKVENVKIEACLLSVIDELEPILLTDKNRVTDKEEQPKSDFKEKSNFSIKIEDNKELIPQKTEESSHNFNLSQPQNNGVSVTVFFVITNTESQSLLNEKNVLLGIGAILFIILMYHIFIKPQKA